MQEKKLQIIKAMFERYENGEWSNKRHIQKIADEVGVEDLNWVYEVVELSWVEWYRTMIRNLKIQGATVGQISKEVWDFYKNIQPTFSALDSNKKIYQQYSTSAIVASMAGHYTDKSDWEDFIEPLYHYGPEIFEPSAGNGLLTIWFFEDKRRTVVNELDATRLDNLSLYLGTNRFRYNQVMNQDATLPFKGLEKSFDVVLTNPPFGAFRGSEYRIGEMQVKLDEKMAQVALDTMRDDGRASIILGEHIEFEGKTIRGRLPFYNWLCKHYNVVDIINIDSPKLYAKQGTSYPLKMILIAGRKEKPFGRAPLVSEMPQIAEIVSTWQDLLKRVETAKLVAEQPFENLDDKMKKIITQIKMAI